MEEEKQNKRKGWQTNGNDSCDIDKTAMGSQNKSKHIVADGRDLSQVVTLLQKNLKETTN